MRQSSLLAATAAAAALLVAAPTTAVPAPAAPTAGASAPAPGPAADGARVTLVTGDVAELTVRPDGVPQARLVAGPHTGEGTHAFVDHGDAYLVPAVAQPLLAQDRLDLELFNVSELVEEGYDDGVPLIVDYGAPRGARATLAAPQGTEDAEPLPSIGAVAARTVPDESQELWTVLEGDAGHAPQKVWLDAPVEATLDESAKEIGAPAAWDRGLTGDGVTIATLDSGIDVGHPDFDDRIVATADFTGSGSVADVAGHGTHVASIAAGSGAASDGTYRGVASDADLLVGKVLDDQGNGTMSATIEGMQWAVAHGADVVNLSLGGPVTNGDDPMSQAVDELTASSGALFVVAAGNHSRNVPGMGFVTSPAAAESALAVGGLRRPTELWDPSRRGRMDGQAIKPEITAPAYGITAAGSSDAGLPTYVSGTGTSMAAPHVAGAAALLKQQHPEWTAEELRDALTSTAVPLDDHYRSDEQGAGRVDVDRATRQSVYVDAGTLQLGYFGRPYRDLTVVRTLTYRNESDAPVELRLSTELHGARQEVVPEGVLTVQPATLRLGPGESRAVQVRLDARTVQPDTYSGHVTATAEGVEITTTVGFYKQDDTVDLSLKALDRRGRPTTATVRISSYKGNDPRHDQNAYYYLDPQQTEYTLRLPEGDYNLLAVVLTMDENGDIEETSVVGNPRLRVRAPNFEVTLDARQAVPLRVETPRPSTTHHATVSWWRGQPGTVLYGEDSWSWHLDDPHGPRRVSITPTAKVSDAPFGVVTSFSAEGPEQGARYAYDLSFAESGRVPVDMTYRVRARDLARVRTTVHDSGVGNKGVLMHQSKFTSCDCSSPALESWLPEVGYTRTDFVTAGPGTTSISAWQYYYNDAGDLLYSRGPTTYEAGQRAEEEWLKAPYSPGVPQSAIRAAGRSPVSVRDGDRLYYSLAAFTDAAGHWAPNFLPATASSRVYLDGEQVHENTSGTYGTLTAPARQGTYRIETDLAHDGTLVGLSTRTHSEWTFRSAPTREEQPLPLVDVDYVDVRRNGSGKSALDATNAAPRNARVELVLSATHQQGSVAPPVRRMDVEVSYDDGATWQEATVAGGSGEFVASYRHPAAGDFVSLRVHARDGVGGRLDQTLIRAYRLR